MMGKKRSGFTLIELIIVIFLMLLIYSLVFTYYKKEQKRPQPLAPSNLKETLLRSIPSGEYATFLCTHECQTCYLRTGDKNRFVPYSDALDLEGTESYAVDGEEELSLLEYGKFNGEDVCLKIDFYPNKSSTQIVLKNPGGIYFLPAFFGKTRKVDTLEEAQAMWLENTNLVSDEGDYY